MGYCPGGSATRRALYGLISKGKLRCGTLIAYLTGATLQRTDHVIFVKKQRCGALVVSFSEGATPRRADHIFLISTTPRHAD